MVTLVLPGLPSTCASCPQPQAQGAGGGGQGQRTCLKNHLQESLFLDLPLSGQGDQIRTDVWIKGLGVAAALLAEVAKVPELCVLFLLWYPPGRCYKLGRASVAYLRHKVGPLLAELGLGEEAVLA